MTSSDKYSIITAISEKHAWKIDDILPKDLVLDYSGPHLPDILTGAETCPHLDAQDKVDLGHIRAASYANLFAFVEEFIIEMAGNLAVYHVHRNNIAARAMFRFAEEETKHQDMFQRYVLKFQDTFKKPCDFLEGASDVAGVVNAKSQLAVLLLTYHLEIVTQYHYTAAVKDKARLVGPLPDMLRAHWIEEAQHASLDQLEISRIAHSASQEAIDQSISEYTELLAAVAGLLEAQSNFDVTSLERCRDQDFTDAQRDAIAGLLHRNLVDRFIADGTNSSKFMACLDNLQTGASRRVAELYPLTQPVAAAA